MVIVNRELAGFHHGREHLLVVSRASRQSLSCSGDRNPVLEQCPALKQEQCLSIEQEQCHVFFEQEHLFNKNSIYKNACLAFKQEQCPASEQAQCLVFARTML